MIIGFSGKIGVGKTTMAEQLVGSITLPDCSSIGLLSFGTEVKKATAAFFDVEISHFYDRDKKEEVLPMLGHSPRRLMQLLATDFVRKMIDTDYWVKKTADIYYSMNNLVVCIDDCRFQNEAEFIRSTGGFLVHLTRNVPDQPEEVSTHEGENNNLYQKGDVVLHLPNSIEMSTELVRAVVLIRLRERGITSVL